MLLKVIYPDGTPGIVQSPTVEELIKAEKIVAFHWAEEWVEVRRKRNSDYKGPERRVMKAF